MSFADFLFQKGNMADHNIDITNAPKITIQSTDEERAEALGFFKKKRTVQRIQFTKAMNACQRALSGPPSKEKEIEATYLLQKAKEILMTLRKIQDIILDCTEDPKEMDALDEQDALFDDASIQIGLMKTTLAPPAEKDKGKQNEPTKTTEEKEATPKRTRFIAGTPSSSLNLTEEQIQIFSLTNQNYDVTKEVPNFDGIDLQTYSSFRVAWETADKQLTKLGKTPCEKLVQLKRCLSGTPHKYIRSLPDSSDENYLGALSLLDNYYYDNRVTAKLLIDKLLELPRMTNDITSTEETFFELTMTDQILKGLSLTGDQCRTLLFTSICETKLNNFMLKAWAKKCEQKKDIEHPLGHCATEMDLFEVLKTEIKTSRTCYTKKNQEPPKREEKPRKREEFRSIPGSFSTGATQTNKGQDLPYCIFCKKKCHFLANCTVLKPLSIDERKKLLRDKRLCNLCFSTEHNEKTCTYASCTIDNCGQRHNKMLHVYTSRTGNTHSAQAELEQDMNLQLTHSCSLGSNKTEDKSHRIAILQSCMAWAVSPSGERFKARIFLDPGSELCLIRRQLAMLMGLNGKHVTLQMKVTGGGVTAPTQEKDVSFRLESLDARYISQDIEATTIKEITAKLRDIPFETDQFQHFKGITFTEEYPRQATEIDILIGTTEYNNLVTGTPIRGQPHEPAALPTKLGYVLSGSFKGKENDL